MIPIELAALVALVSLTLVVVVGILIQRTLSGRRWSAGEVVAWTQGYAAGRKDRRRNWEAAEVWAGPAADPRRADVVGELAWPMEGSDRPEWQ